MGNSEEGLLASLRDNGTSLVYALVSYTLKSFNGDTNSTDTLPFCTSIASRTSVLIVEIYSGEPFTLTTSATVPLRY